MKTHIMGGKITENLGFESSRKKGIFFNLLERGFKPPDFQ
jgi:hypothetical protein